MNHNLFARTSLPQNRVFIRHIRANKPINDGAENNVAEKIKIWYSGHHAHERN